MGIASSKSSNLNSALKQNYKLLTFTFSAKVKNERNYIHLSAYDKSTVNGTLPNASCTKASRKCLWQILDLHSVQKQKKDRKKQNLCPQMTKRLSMGLCQIHHVQKPPPSV